MTKDKEPLWRLLGCIGWQIDAAWLIISDIPHNSTKTLILASLCATAGASLIVAPPSEYLNIRGFRNLLGHNNSPS